MREDQLTRTEHDFLVACAETIEHPVPDVSDVELVQKIMGWEVGATIGTTKLYRIAELLGLEKQGDANALFRAVCREAAARGYGNEIYYFMHGTHEGEPATPRRTPLLPPKGA